MNPNVTISFIAWFRPVVSISITEPAQTPTNRSIFDVREPFLLDFLIV